jgi:hypothetical protein
MIVGKQGILFLVDIESGRRDLSLPGKTGEGILGD